MVSEASGVGLGIEGHMVDTLFVICALLQKPLCGPCVGDPSQLSNQGARLALAPVAGRSYPKLL